MDKSIIEKTQQYQDEIKKNIELVNTQLFDLKIKKMKLQKLLKLSESQIELMKEQ